MKKLIAVMILLMPVLFSCKNDDITQTGKPPAPLANPKAKWVVFSDPHYFDPDLGTTGNAFEAVKSRDRKMLAESEAILESVIATLLQLAPDFVIIPGDMTKDGELSGHQKMATFLNTLEESGIDVYLVPGNHDINNPHASSYNGDQATPVPAVTPLEFETLYSNFGFNEAIDRDANSLTYIVEPVEGLWLFCMDACRYSENTAQNFAVGGRFKASTLQWIKDRLLEAKQLGKMVLGVMHHGLLEHFEYQADYFADFVVEDGESISKDFAMYGMRAVFTGHFHAQDIVGMTTASSFLFDIETGSTITYRCPYRVMTLGDDYRLTVQSYPITQINYDLGGKDFQTYARDFLTDGVLDIMRTYAEEYGISQADVEDYGPVVIQAALDHLSGDEVMTPEAQALIDELRNRGDVYSNEAANVLESIYNDPTPADNDILIHLKSGNVNRL